MKKSNGALLTAVLVIIFFLLLIKVVIVNKKSSEGPPYNVIVITLASVRNIDTLEDKGHRFIPYLWKELFPKGVVYTNLVNLNYPFHSMPAAAALSGYDYPNGEFPEMPDIMERLRKQYNLPKEKVWSFAALGQSWCTPKGFESMTPAYFSAIALTSSGELENIISHEELVFLNNYRKMLEESHIPDMLKVGAYFYYMSWDSYGDIFYRMFKAIIQRHHPVFIHYVMTDPECAHYDTLAKYLFAIKRCDERIFQIWKMIQSDAVYKNKTYLLVVCDNSRDDYYMQHDQHLYDDPFAVWLYMYGPGIKENAMISRPIKHTDIFATLARIMKLKDHAGKGEILKDAFN